MALMDAVADEAGGGDDGSSDMDDLDALSDTLYDQSFGPGSFAANEYGGRTFTPQAEIDKALKEQQSQQAASDETNNLRTPTYGPTPQIRNLRQLGMVAKALKGVPDEIRNRVLSHLLGKPYQSPQEVKQEQQRGVLENAIKLARVRHGLAQPDKQVAEARRMESLKQRENYQRQLIQLRKRQMMSTEQNRKAQLGQHREGAKTTLANSIANLTRAMGMTADPEQQVELGKVLMKQHKLYDQLATFEDKLSEKEQEQQGGGEGSSTGAGEQY